MKIRKSLKKIPIYIYVSILIFIILLILLQIPEIAVISAYIESPVYDIAMRLKKKPRIHQDIAIVTITDNTDIQIGKFPWKEHSTYRQFVMGIKLMKPKLVVWDIIFSPRAENDYNKEFKKFTNIYKKINSVSVFSLRNDLNNSICNKIEYEKLVRYIKNGFKEFLLSNILTNFIEINNHNLSKCINKFVTDIVKQIETYDFKKFLNYISNDVLDNHIKDLVSKDNNIQSLPPNEKIYIKTREVMNKIFKDDTGIISELYNSFVALHSSKSIKDHSAKIDVISKINVPRFNSIDPVSHIVLLNSHHLGFSNISSGKYYVIRDIPIVLKFYNTYSLSLPVVAYYVYKNYKKAIITKNELLLKKDDNTTEHLFHDSNAFLVDFLKEIDNGIDASQLIFLYRKYNTIRTNIVDNFELLQSLESQLLNTNNIKKIVKKNLPLPKFIILTEKLANSLYNEILNLISIGVSEEELASYYQIRDFLAEIRNLIMKLKEEYKSLYPKINNKVVFVGANKGGADLKSTSLGSNYPGILIHVSAFNSLLKKTSFTYVKKWISYLIVSLVLIISYYFIIKRGAIVVGIFIVFVLLGLFFLKVELLNKNKYFNYSDNFILLFLPVSVAIIIKERVEGKTKKILKQTFQNYISKDVLDYLLANPDKIKLGGETKEATVFFSDMSGFTTFSEKYRPEYVISILNEYLAIITHHILENRGFLDKYEGDGVMAAFGIPIEFAESAELACKASCGIKREFQLKHDQLHQEGFPLLKIRIGLSTGKIIAGNIGSEKRLDYTLIGDYVNLGNRLEQANKSFGTTILMEENTYNKVKDKFYTRKIGIIKVKGKGHFVKVYELIDEVTNKDIDEHFIKLFNKAVELFLEKNIREAKYMFEKLYHMKSDDNPTNTYLSICNELLKHGSVAEEDLVIKLG